MKKIYYWEQALILRNLSDYQALLKEVIQKLLMGDYASAGLEQLKHQDKTIYSARINKKARVIFINFIKDRQSSLLILDVLENHEYERCQFLNNQYIKTFLGSITPEELIRCETPEALPIESLTENTEINLQSLHYFQGQMIELTVPQHESLHLPLPALIEGEAGSGKTCVGLCALSNFLNERMEEDVRVLYLAPFKSLVDDMQLQWQSLNGNPRAEFKIYDELFTVASISSTQLIDWITRTASFPAPCSQNLLKEFAMMQLLETPEDYLALGEKQSLVPDLNRRKVWDLFQNFTQHFNFQEVYHPWFSPLRLREQYDFIFIDESQSFTAYQLLQILGSAKNHAVLAGFDRHQRVAGDRRDMLRFKAICHHKSIPLHHSQLQGSFRCPQQVVQLVNNLLSIKYTLAQGRPDKGSILKYVSKKEDPGQVHYFLESRDDASIRALLPQGSRHWAIITTPELKAQAREKFATPLVFTPQEILGLGYELILLYHMGQQAVVSEISKKLPEEPLKDFQHGARVELPENYLGCLNEWIISASRAHQALLVVEPNARKTHAIRHFINHLLRHDVCVSHDAPLIALPHDTDWSEEVLRLLSLNLEEQASAAYEQYIRPQTHLSMATWRAQKAPCTSYHVEPVETSIESISKNIQALSLKPMPEPSPSLSPAEVITKEDFKNALENITRYTENETLYNQHLKKYFVMEWDEWKPFVLQEGHVGTMLTMLNKYDEIQTNLTSEPAEPFFNEEEDYTNFLRFSLSPYTNPFIKIFNQYKTMPYLVNILKQNPRMISFDFLNFLITDDYITQSLVIKKTGIDEFVTEAISVYFSNLPEEISAEDLKHYRQFFYNYMELALGMAGNPPSDELLEFLLKNPELWPLMGFEIWGKIPKSLSSNLLIQMLNHPKSLQLLEQCMTARHINATYFFNVVLKCAISQALFEKVFSSPVLCSQLLQECDTDYKIYQEFKSKFTNILFFETLFRHSYAIDMVLELVARHLDFWSDCHYGTPPLIYRQKKETSVCTSSFLLKILMDVQQSSLTNISKKINTLFLSGAPPFYQAWGDELWICPQLIWRNEQKTSLCWILSPIPFLARCGEFYELLKILLKNRPALISFLKWAIDSNSIPEAILTNFFDINDEIYRTCKSLDGALIWDIENIMKRSFIRKIDSTESHSIKFFQAP